MNGAHPIGRATRCLALALVLSAAGASAQRDRFDIGSGGPAIMQGAMNGSVVANVNLLADLQVTVNFGELSPMNRNPVVRVAIPVAIRSNDPYQVTITTSGTSTNSDPMALQLSDIGFGIQSLRPMSGGRVCRQGHTVQQPFNNDPSLTVNFTSRASYPSNLAMIAPSKVVLVGPRLSKGNNINPRQTDNGYLFDLVLAVAPQFFAPSSASVTLTLSISQGPPLECQ